jgi:hypothetical protein
MHRNSICWLYTSIFASYESLHESVWKVGWFNSTENTTNQKLGNYNFWIVSTGTLIKAKGDRVDNMKKIISKNSHITTRISNMRRMMFLKIRWRSKLAGNV